ncbi:MAG: NAD(P)-dependent oxidoreductase [Actinomycetota bacterium]|nr:NAD(P)-dependent oxidoreductase [Actinomycetota bacterium]
MRVFVAGATGAIGRPVVRQLAAAGHDVVGMTRREERAAQIREVGAEAVVCDAFDAEGLRDAVVAARPEVVVHLLTALPQRYDRKSDWLEPTNRIRREGTRNLVEAAVAAGARRMVAESIAFVYRQEGGWTKGEEEAIEDRAGPGVAVADLERQVRETDLEGLVLRYGWFYGPGTYFDRGGQEAEQVEKRRFPIVGKGTGTFSFVSTEDAAAATVAALEKGRAGQAYNIVDDEPVRWADYLDALAAELAVRRPRRVPTWMLRAIPYLHTLMTTSMRVSNAKARRELGWAPVVSTYREGIPLVARASR